MMPIKMAHRSRYHLRPCTFVPDSQQREFGRFVAVLMGFFSELLYEGRAASNLLLLMGL
ncbi:hypothetical protein ALP71_00726 [Pseudomonas coronafaciens pv. garcae]|nr:hypothetical protein ALP71_00726 [Pseudomonas coronafaciens pv. garcae]